jgi:hypothetical protein
MDLIDGYEILHGPLVLAQSLVCVLYCVPIYIAIVPQLQIWHSLWLLSVKSLRDLHFKVSQLLHFT